MPAASAIQSMTGYGRATKETPVGSVTVELRSTNHRYLELDAKLPNGLTALQARLAELLRSAFRRGRVEVQVAVHSTRGAQRRVTFDEPLLQRYHTALVELKTRYALKGPILLEHLLALPQALTVSEERVPAERSWEAIRETAKMAARELTRSREREGAKLVADLRRQTQLIETGVRAIQQRLPKALEQQRRRLRQRLREILGSPSGSSPAQLEQVVSLVRDADIHEELVRLDSHLTHMRQVLTSRGRVVGKQLDFIAQELMRETNTMGAKVNDPIAAQHVVDIKGCIEKIREQVQNLE